MLQYWLLDDNLMINFIQMKKSSHIIFIKSPTKYSMSSCTTAAVYCKIQCEDLEHYYDSNKMQSESEPMPVLMVCVPPLVQVFLPYHPFTLLAQSEVDVTVVQVEPFSDSNKFAFLSFNKKLYIVTVMLLLGPDQANGQLVITHVKSFDLLEEARYFQEEPLYIINYGTYLLVDFQHQFLIYNQRVMKSFLKYEDIASFTGIPFNVASRYLNKPQMHIEQEDNKFKIRKSDTSNYDFLLVGTLLSEQYLSSNIILMIGVTKDSELIKIKTLPLEMGVEKVYLIDRIRSLYLYKSIVLDQVTIIDLDLQIRVAVIDFNYKIKQVFLSYGEEAFSVLATDGGNIKLKLSETKRPEVQTYHYKKEINIAIILDDETFLVGSVNDDLIMQSSKGTVIKKNLGQIINIQMIKEANSKQRQIGIVSRNGISLLRKGINIEKIQCERNISQFDQKAKGLFLLHEGLFLLSFDKSSILLKDNFIRANVSSSYIQHERTLYLGLVLHNWVVQVTVKQCCFFYDPKINESPFMNQLDIETVHFEHKLAHAFGSSNCIYTLNQNQTLSCYHVKFENNAPYLELNGQLNLTSSISSIALNKYSEDLFVFFWLQPTCVTLLSPALKNKQIITIVNNANDNIVSSTFHSHQVLILGLSSGYIQILQLSDNIFLEINKIHLSSSNPINLVPYHPFGTLCIGNQLFLLNIGLETSIVNWDFLEDASSAEGFVLGRLKNGKLQIVQLHQTEDKLLKTFQAQQNRIYLTARFFGHLIILLYRQKELYCLELLEIDTKLVKDTKMIYDQRPFGLLQLDSMVDSFIVYGEQLNNPSKRGFFQIVNVKNAQTKYIITSIIINNNLALFLYETTLKIYQINYSDTFNINKQYHLDLQMPLRGADWSDNYFLIRDGIKGVSYYKCCPETKQLVVLASQECQCTEARFLGQQEQGLPNVVIFERNGSIKIYKINNYSLGILDQLKLLHLERLSFRFPIYSIDKKENSLVLASICGEVGFLQYLPEQDAQQSLKSIVRLEKPAVLRKGGPKIIYLEQLLNNNIIRIIENQLF